MTLFRRKVHSGASGEASAPKETASAPPAVPKPVSPLASNITVPSPAKEKPMDQPTNTKSSLLEETVPKRRTTEDVGGLGGATRHTSGTETFISPDTVIEGKILAKGELRIDGTFKGEILSSDRVNVGTGGKLEANVEARAMVVSGQVVGNVRILERLELLSTGEIYGDLETQPGALIIEKGARIEGRCSMGLSASEGRSTPSRPSAKPSTSVESTGAPQQIHSTGSAYP
jgi:cytoskeletal protein CcmA (bactofilin family)